MTAFGYDYWVIKKNLSSTQKGLSNVKLHLKVYSQ